MATMLHDTVIIVAPQLRGLALCGIGPCSFEAPYCYSVELEKAWRSSGCGFGIHSSTLKYERGPIYLSSSNSPAA